MAPGQKGVSALAPTGRTRGHIYLERRERARRGAELAAERPQPRALPESRRAALAPFLAAGMTTAQAYRLVYAAAVIETAEVNS